MDLSSVAARLRVSGVANQFTWLVLAVSTLASTAVRVCRLIIKVALRSRQTLFYKLLVLFTAFVPVVLGCSVLGEFPTEPVTREAHPYPHRAVLSVHSLSLLPQLAALVSLKLLTGSEEWLDDRRTRGVAELREETSRRGAIPVGARGGLGVNREIVGGESEEDVSRPSSSSEPRRSGAGSVPPAV
ncbi:hypothetical protein Taro_024088 [Colocasia esculenta]|uniref:Uncharacterized protein n=1 Tax=Colocasia esculenta TaxID=4460 RepID=A0A843VCN9_COLES|nr:hypothetical protein [Colocasia esculenta]